MPKARKSAAAKNKPAAKKTKRPASAKKQAAARFVEDLLVRQEAAKPGPDGKLPPQATHAITKENPDGTTEVKRARFKLF